MTADHPATRRDENAPRAAGSPVAETSNPWLFRQKVTVPDPVAGHLLRPQLVERAMPTRQRVTVLKAPAGFGKTTLLAECCRRLGEDGVRTAWVSLDERDEPAVLDAYIAFACRSGGLEFPDGPVPGDASGVPWSGAALVARAVEALGSPFVLALDELGRLSNPASVALLEFLLHRGPPNLHLAMTCREFPVGLNVGGALLEGRTTVVTAEELRFSKADIAKFFDLGLSRGELAAITAHTAGWPFAVRISRNRRESTEPESTRTVQDFVENWMVSRLFEEFGADERDFLLDIGLFEWMDAELLDDVLQRTASMRRFDTIPGLTGLLEPVPGDAMDRWRLHPLIRDHCNRRQYLETPQRFKSIHRRIAKALMKRGETVTALRHAIEAEEGTLAGDILEHAGGVRMQMRQGLEQFMIAEQLLSEHIISNRPRLELSRCLALVLSGRLAEARERYAAVAAALPALIGDGSEGDFELSVDDCIVRGNIALHGAERIGSEWVQALLPDLSRLAESPRLDPLTHGNLQYRLCIVHQLSAQFDTALDHAVLARQNLVNDRSMNIFIDLEVGQIAMAQGRVEDAEQHYGRAQGAVRTSDIFDAAPAVVAKILLRELALERNRLAPVAELPRVPGTLVAAPPSFSAYAAASGAVVDLRFRHEGVDGALAAADKMLEFVLGAGLPALIRYLSALRVSLLAAAARVEDAERDWRLHELPEAPKDCLDLNGQSWREMEALSCARLRLLTAREHFGEGRSFARDLCAVAAARGLRRTLMRALSLSMALEHQAGEPAAAAGKLEEFLNLFGETPYAWPLVRDQEASTPVLESFLDSVPDSPRRDTVLSLLAAMRAPDEPRNPPVLSERERQVLERLEGRQDKQIAAALGLSAHGVRYHMRKVFTKLGARNRADAVRRARELGLILGDF